MALITEKSTTQKSLTVTQTPSPVLSPRYFVVTHKPSS